MTYAIVKTGGKQYRVQEGQHLLVERLPDDDGARVELQTLLYVDGSTVLDGADLNKVKVEARIMGKERGPKLRIVKFKPKRGYKRRTGHRQDLTRIEVTGIKLSARTPRKAAAASEETPKPVAAAAPEQSPKPVAAVASKEQDKPVVAEQPPVTESSEPTSEATDGA